MKKIILYITIAVFSFSCESFLEETPVDLITSDQVIVDAGSAQTAVLGIYSRLQIDNLYGNDLVNLPAVASDEFVHSGSFPTIAEIDNNSINSTNITADDMWTSAYTGIFQSNNVLEALENNTELPGFTPELRAEVNGQARFLRALLHFNLTNIYGDVPLLTTTALDVTNSPSRTPQADVLQFVLEEARLAASELENADFGNNTQFRANYWAAKALEARTLLYQGNVTEAGAVANTIIESGEFSLAESYGDLFQPGPAINDEIIFSIYFSASDQNGIAFQYLPDGRFEFAVSPQLEDALTADPDDERADFIAVNQGDAQGRSYVNKYTDLSTGTDGFIVFRLAEMYLIRAEANIGSSIAINDVNEIRSRAGVATLSAVNEEIILQERFRELFAEGHRWYDLIRTGNAVSTMSAINPSFSADDTLFPVPNRDILLNPNLLPQNSGY